MYPCLLPIPTFRFSTRSYSIVNHSVRDIVQFSDSFDNFLLGCRVFAKLLTHEFDRLFSTLSKNQQTTRVEAVNPPTVP